MHWTIKKVDLQVAKAHALLNCRIVETDKGVYEFQDHHHNTVSSTTDNVFPIKFPKFKSKLNGNDDLEWFIMVAPYVGGEKESKMTGTWSNRTYIPPHRHDAPDDPTDSWTAQGGAGAGDDEESAASASA